MLIYLIRHGATVYNEERRYQGLIDIPLSEAGRAALRQADFSPETVYVSPLSRAKETAAVLFPAATQIVVSSFCEMDFGAFEGRTAGEMEDDPAYRAWVEGGCTGRCPGGESLAEFSERVWGAFVPLLEVKTERLVVVAHGGAQMAILDRYVRPHRGYFHWHAPCGGGFMLDGPTLIGEVRF
ncbi:histidine phosphatase family protein [Oscillospiraceae bacterium 44-5]